MLIPILQTLYKFETPPELESEEYKFLKQELDKDQNLFEKNKQTFYDLNSTGINLCILGVLIPIIGLSIQREGILVAISGFSIFGVLSYSILYLIPESLSWSKATIKKNQYFQKLKTDLLNSYSFEDYQNIRAGRPRILHKIEVPNNIPKKAESLQNIQNEFPRQSVDNYNIQVKYNIDDVYNNLIENRIELNKLYVLDKMDSDFFLLQYSAFALLSFQEVFQNIKESDKLNDQVKYFKENYLNPKLLRWPSTYQSKNEFIVKKKKSLIEKFNNQTIIRDSKNKELSLQMAGTVFVDRNSEIKKSIARLEFESIILEYIIFIIDKHNNR